MKELKKIIVIGANVGGVSSVAKAYLTNPGLEINVYDKAKTPSYLTCIFPYIIALKTDPVLGNVLSKSQIEANFPISKVFMEHEVLKVDTDNKSVKVRNLKTGEVFDDHYDRLMVASGHYGWKPPIKGLDEVKRLYWLKNYEDMLNILDAMEEIEPKKILLIGGGIIGLELAEAMVDRGVKDIDIIEICEIICGPLFDPLVSKRLDEEISKHNIRLHYNSFVEEMFEDQNKKINVVVNSKKGKETYKVDLVFASTGGRPNTKILEGTNIKLNERGLLVTNEYLQSVSNPDVFAAGDVIENYHMLRLKNPDGSEKKLRYALPLASGGIRGAHVAGTNYGNRNKNKWWKFRGFTGTTLVGIFDKTVGKTGLLPIDYTRYDIQGSSIEREFVFKKDNLGHGRDDLAIAFHWETKTGLILGMSAFGGDYTNGQIDIIATQIANGGTIFDLANLEIPFSPVHAQGQVPIVEMAREAVRLYNKANPQAKAVI